MGTSGKDVRGSVGGMHVTGHRRKLWEDYGVDFAQKKEDGILDWKTLPEQRPI